MKNPINQVVIEGPDLSGKTTLYQRIHDKTSYKWNIQDRSSLSMLIHAKLYGRQEFQHVESLKSELNNLNNIMILLLPKWEVISKRFSERGDEIQNLSSLRKIYLLFEEAAEEFENFPNVYVIRKEVDDQIADLLINDMIKYESLSFSKMSEVFCNHSLNSTNNESIGLTLTSFDYGDFNDVSLEDLNYEKEKVYYENIKNSVLKKIDSELSGINEYNRVEDMNSRRFIYSSDTCISLAHFMLRNNMLNCDFFIRSSNTKDTLKYDLNFLKYLSMKVKERLCLSEKTITKLNVKINSAHVLAK